MKMIRKSLQFTSIFFIFMALLAQDAWNPFDIRLDSGDPPGANPSYDPQVACSGETVYAVWADSRSGFWEIFFNSSTNGGATWQPQPTRVDSASVLGDRAAMNPQIACSGRYVYVAWEDFRNGLGSDVYFNSSSDGGKTWQDQDILLNTGDIPGLNSVNDVRIANSGKYVYVVWVDDRDGSYSGYQDIYFNYSTDRGMTWQAQDVRLNTNEKAISHFIWDLQIVSSKENVYVVWGDTRSDWRRHVYFNRSADFGATWLPQDKCLDVGDDIPDFTSYGSRIACTGKFVYVVWSDDRDGERDIYSNCSHDGGITWQTRPTRLDTSDSQEAYYSVGPVIVCFENDVYVAWDEERDNSSYIFFNYSSDAGVTWQEQGMNLTLDETDVSDSAAWPEIACSGNSIFVIWAKLENDTQNIYFKYSADGGKTWLLQGVRLDNGDALGSRSLRYQIACWDKDAHVVWEDDRNGETDIYFNTISIDSKIIFAPRYFSGRKVFNRSLLQTETLIELTWEKNLDNQDNNISSYRIYLVRTEQIGYLSNISIMRDIKTQSGGQKMLSIQSQKEFLAEIDANILKYWHRNVDDERTYNYLIVAVDDEGNEGLPAYLTVQ